MADQRSAAPGPGDADEDMADSSAAPGEAAGEAHTVLLHVGYIDACVDTLCVIALLPVMRAACLYTYVNNNRDVVLRVVCRSSTTSARPWAKTAALHRR